MHMHIAIYMGDYLGIVKINYGTHNFIGEEYVFK